MPASKPSNEKWTIREILRWTAVFFSEKGIESARLDAELLLAHALKRDRLYLYLNLDAPLSSNERELFRGMVRRRAAREPVALIVGTKEFWSLTLKVVPGVLSPRPDTEILVETVVKLLASFPKAWVLEIGTGSGAIATALADEAPDAFIVATDVDVLAATTARDNIRACKTEHRVCVAVSTLFDALKPGVSFDVICSNPPYVRTADIDALPPEISCFEPRRALDGGPDGLDFIRRITRDCRGYLKDRGCLCLEIGHDQEREATAILSDYGFAKVNCVPDLAGSPRVVVGRRA